jgi:hypothetical protein
MHQTQRSAVRKLIQMHQISVRFFLRTDTRGETNGRIFFNVLLASKCFLVCVFQLIWFVCDAVQEVSNKPLCFAVSAVFWRSAQ